jgi:hypothetical protein
MRERLRAFHQEFIKPALCGSYKTPAFESRKKWLGRSVDGRSDVAFELGIEIGLSSLLSFSL